MVARQALSHRRSVAFGRSWRDTKGFVVATLDRPELGGEIDVVSVHLDFLAAEQRREQLAVMIEALSPRSRPLIVMGDFNCTWDLEEACVATLAEALNLHTYQPKAALFSFPADAPTKRLDWILISEELRFADYGVLPQQVSDHLAVVATIAPAARRD